MSVNEEKKNKLFSGLFNKERQAPKKLKKTTKRIIIWAVIVAVTAGALLAGFLGKKKDTGTEINTAVATVGSVRSVISASGTIQPKDMYDVVSSVRGDVLSDTFEVGDVIKKGTVLYELDKSDMSDTVEKAEMSMDRTRDSYQDTVDSINDLTVKAPIEGVISQMFVSEGDSISNGTKVCEIIDKSKMKLTIPFNTSDIGYIGVGMSADVTLQNSFYKTTGYVTRVSSGSLINEFNVAVSYVDIEVENPGGITVNDTATAVINTFACNSAGTFEYAGKKTVSAKTSGDIVTVYNSLGDYVYEGSTILQMESDTVADSMKNADRSLREAQMSLNKTYEQLEDYTIQAKIDGTIIEKNIKAGDTLDNTNGNTVMCVIADMSVISFSINVDELDVDKIALNQAVDITADALPNKRYTGHVNSININGSTSNGVTTYPVEVIVDNPEGMLPGMNVNAEIVIAEKQNVLRVPVSAVMRGNMVYVKEEDVSKIKEEDKVNNDESSKSPFGNRGFGKNNGEQQSDEQDKEVKAPGNTDSQKSANTLEKPMAGNKTEAAPAENKTEAAPTKNKTEKTGEAENKNAGSDNKNSSGQKGNTRGFGNVPEGFVAVRVETGINDDNFIEILSGLSEGVTVYVKSQSTTASQGMMGMPGMGGMGMPGMGGMGGMGGMNRPTGNTGTQRRN